MLLTALMVKTLVGAGIDEIIYVWNLNDLNSPPTLLTGHENVIF